MAAPPPIPNIAAPMAAVLMDPATGLFYGGSAVAAASALPIPNRSAPQAVIPFNPTTGLPS